MNKSQKNLAQGLNADGSVPKKRGRKPKEVLKRKNVLIRKLTKEDNDVIDQVEVLTCEGTATKAILSGLRKLLDLQERLDKQAAELKELRTLTRNVLMADSVVTSAETKLNDAQELKAKARETLATTFQEKHLHGLGYDATESCSRHYYRAEDGCPDCLAATMNLDENFQEVDEADDVPEESRIY